MLLLPLSIYGQEVIYNADNIPMPHYKDANRYTSNPDNVLNQAAVDSIDAISLRLDKNHGIEMVFVVVNNVEGGDVYPVGEALFDKHKFGKKDKDTGLLVIISKNDRGYFIHTGKGMEGVLPDAICSRIGSKVLVPELKNDNWSEGALKTARAIEGIIEDDPEFAELVSAEDDDEGLGGIGIFVVGVAAACVYGAYAGRRKCPLCKKAMKQIGRQVVSKSGYITTYNVQYRCPKCGHEMSILEKVDRTPSVGGGVGGGYRGSSGGSHGGSFGGGSYGGGGAGGRF